MADGHKPQDATKWLRILGSYTGTTWPAGSIELIESHLGQGHGGHPRYETVATTSLGGREPDSLPAHL